MRLQECSAGYAANTGKILNKEEPLKLDVKVESEAIVIHKDSYLSSFIITNNSAAASECDMLQQATTTA